MTKLVDVPDLKFGGFGRAGSIPAPGTTPHEAKSPVHATGLFAFPAPEITAP